MELQFYIKEDIKECWKVKALKRQINSSLFQRLALSTDKEGVLAPANEGYEVLTPANIIHAPYVLEFVEIPQQRDGTRKSFEDQHGAIPIGIRQMPLLAYQLVPDISKLI